MVDKLQDLLAKGPPPNRGLRGLILSRFKEITLARHQLWQWAEIAEALDLPPASGPSLGEAFRRVEKKVRAGKLEPPPPPSTPAPAARRPTSQAGISAEGAIGDRAQAARGQSNKDFLASLKQIGGDK